MRSLWTAASGMKTQQMNVDTISNNLANVNTVGFKKERLGFKSLLYETIKEGGDVSQGGAPVNLQVGHGVKAVSNVKSFTQGNYERTENPLDFAIKGKGFFAISGMDGEEIYTKDGTFKISLVDDELMLTTDEGQLVLNTNDEPITFDRDIAVEKISVASNGDILYVEDGEKVELGMKFKIVQFKNPAGLLAKGDNFYDSTVASGEAISEEDDDGVVKSDIAQGAVESSNVQVVEEMVKLIVAQRAYEISSKAIQTADSMLAQANELKR
jgi:flagellar basal-body rod protein FlgG